MSDVGFTSEQVADATRQSLVAVYGEHSAAVDILTGRVLGHLLLDSANVAAPESEQDFSQPPRYAERALAASSPDELVSLAGEACQRLERSVASYCTASRESDQPMPEGVYSLSPYIFAEGTRSGDNASGQLYIKTNIFDDASSQLYGDRTVISLQLIGGEDVPYDPLDEAQSGREHLERVLEVRERTIHDPVTKAEIPVRYVTARSYYKQARGTRSPLDLYEDKGQGGPLTQIIKADVFWALDMAITFYEEVYITGSKHVGLTYADYRDAGCLGDDGRLDWQKAEAYVRTRWDETEQRSGGWPVLGDWENTVLSMDPQPRASVETYKKHMRRFAA